MDKENYLEMLEHAFALGMARIENNLDITVEETEMILTQAIKDYRAPFLNVEYIDKHEEFQYFTAWCRTFLTQEYVDWIRENNR